MVGALALVAAWLAGCGTTYRTTLAVPITSPGGEVPVVAATAEGGEATAPGAAEPIVAPSGPIALDISNNKGGVEVRVLPGATTITVMADVTVSNDIEEKKRPAVADQVALWAHLEPGEGGPNGRGTVLRIKAESPRPESDDHSVKLKIVMPRCDGALVNARGGGVVSLVNVNGAMQVHNRGGAVDVRTDHAIDEPVALTTDTGNVYYQVPKDATGRFDLKSLDGEVIFSSHQPCTEIYARRDVYRCVLNGGVNPVVLQSDTGDVKVMVRDEPVAYTRLVK